MFQSTNKGKSQSLKTRKSIEQGLLPDGLSLIQILRDLQLTKAPNILEAFGFLSARQFRNGLLLKDHGLISCQLVTQAFAQYLVDSLQDSTTYPMDAFEYHATGTDNTAEANTQTALGTEVESRVAGTQIEGGSTNIYRTVATVTYTATRSIVEHGLFTASSVGTMMDRSVFSAISVINLDEVEYTYNLTVDAES